MWPYVCSAPEEQGSPALGTTSWAGKGAQELDSEEWRGSPGLPNLLHGRPTMGGAAPVGLAHAKQVEGSQMGGRLCLPPSCPWMRGIPVHLRSLPE